MFNENMAISKNCIIALCFICLLFFAANINIDGAHAIDADEVGNGTISAIIQFLLIAIFSLNI